MQNYIEYDFTITPREVGAEILLAELAEVGFDSFVDTEDGLLAYIQEPLWNEAILSDIYILQNPDFTVSYTYKTIPQVNWNEEWEKNFEPIVVEGACTVRAPFHPAATTPYEIVITPKMSFGTGHHETTYMMLQFLLTLDLKGKRVLDMGCGTSVLAIMAEKRGAAEVLAVDIDDWCVENSLENIAHNACEHISVLLGDVSQLNGRTFDLIIANINRNILLADIPHYAASLTHGGTLLLSGFYTEDIPAITEQCTAHALRFVQNLGRNNWAAVQFTKQ